MLSCRNSWMMSNRSIQKTAFAILTVLQTVILFGIRKSFSIIDVQEALAKYRLTTLGGQRDGGE